MTEPQRLGADIIDNFALGLKHRGPDDLGFLWSEQGVLRSSREARDVTTNLMLFHRRLSIIDVSDISRPRTLGRHEYDPPHAEPTHTFLKVPFAIGGRQIAVSTEEERPKRGPDVGRPHAPLRTWDVTDPAKPAILFTYQLDEMAQPYHGDAVRFGTHQLREIVDPDCMLYVTWFAAGLRMIDIHDPSSPREKGYFIPQPTEGKTTPWANDVAKDERGLIFLTDKSCGLDVIEFDNA